jgi:sec-independent protein translocase protein TatA
MLGLGPPELIIIAIVILALFGYKKLPDAARAIGRSARIFKAETRGLRDDPAPRDLQSKAEAEYRRDTPPAAPPAAPPPGPTLHDTEPSPTPAPSATPAPPAPVPPSETR